MDPRAAVEALIASADSNPLALLRLARALRADGQKQRAHDLASRAAALAPDDARVRAEFARFMNNAVPSWHFKIVRDERRNAAYDAALRRAVRPDSRVLEIGTGTGLLAMMAARAGAAEVLTCETNPVIAEAATQIVASNGLASRVRVIAKHSDALKAGDDLGGKVDVLVSEIVSNDLLAEDVLPAHERAIRDLVKPGGRVIPARGRIRVALAEDTREDHAPLTQAGGFDVSFFNRFWPRVMPINAGAGQLTLRSEGADLFDFDFGSGSFCAPARSTLICRSTGGRVNGVAQWIALELDEHTVYENQPGPGASSCWAVLFHTFQQPIETSPGDLVRVSGSHDRKKIMIWSGP